MFTLSQIMFIVSLLGAVLLLFKVFSKIGAFAGNLFKISVWAMIGVLVLWGIYNQIGLRLGWWEPLSLDQFLYRIPIIGDLLRKLDEVLGSWGW